MEPNNSILYCNRSAAYVRMSEYKLALNDALKTIELDPEWHKVKSCFHFDSLLCVYSVSVQFAPTYQCGCKNMIRKWRVQL